MIVLADLSRYDPNESADDYDGVILNVEDPGLATKASIAHAAGRKILVYSWVYPGDNGYSTTRGAAAVELLATRGIPSTSFVFLDFEQAGATAQDLRAGLTRARQAGVPAGAYTYLYLLNGLAGLRDVIEEGKRNGQPLWLAYYPDRNDGSYYDAMSNAARQNGAVLHQWTSTNGTRDLNVVLDEGWWNSLGGGVADMATVEEIEQYIFEDRPFGVTRFEVAFKAAVEKHLLPKIAEWENDTRVGIKAALAGDNAALADAIVAKLPAGGDVDGLSKQDVLEALREFFKGL